MIGGHLAESAPDRERWLLSYADLLTLLLAFFVVMYSVSVVNEAKLYEFSTSIRSALDGEGTRPPEVGITDLVLPDFIVKSGIKSLVKAGESDWLEFVIDSGILFASGGANFSATATIALDNMVRILASSRGEIRVEGHTDNMPIANSAYPSNWELSAVRAATVVRFLESGGIAGERLVAIGLGSTQPVGDNATASGRSQNRRVVFSVRQAKVNFAQIAGLSVPEAVGTAELAEGQSEKQSAGRSEEISLELSEKLSAFRIEDIEPALLRQVLRELGDSE